QLLKNNLKLTWRNLIKNPGSTLLNITGLMLGIVCSVIIFLTIRYEVNFDKQHANTSQIYRVTNNYYYPTFTMHVGTTPDPMHTALKTDFPEFESVVPIYSNYNHRISIDEQILESDIIYCGPDFIQLFDYYNNPSEWIIGNPNEILGELNKTILTKSMAEKAFKSPENAIGKIISLSDETQLEVAGVVNDPPNYTNYPFEQLVSYPTFDNIARNTFGGVSSTTTFVQLPKSVTVESLRPALEHFNEKYMEAAWGEDFVSTDLQALSEIHFDERFGSNNYTTNKSYLWTLGLIGLFMILIACINFVNLSTAKAAKRSKEIGMRKVLGSSKKGIIAQFMTESFFLASLSMGLGLMLAQLSFPYFSEITNLNIGNDFTYTPQLILFVTGLLLFITIAMGVYPAIILSNFRPLDVIQQRTSKSTKGRLSLRKSLIAFQLTTSQVLIIAAIVVTCQLHFFQNKDLGFEKESVVVLNINGDESIQDQRTLKNKVQQLPFVQTATLNSSIPMSGHNSTTGLTSMDSAVKDRFNVQYIYADNDFADAMNFKPLAGKTAIAELELDTIRGFVVNETLVNRLAFGSPEAAIGKRINVHGYDSRIIGVVEDFHTMSLHEEIRPVAIIYGVRDYSNLGIKYQSDDLQQSLAQLEETWKTVFPDKNFDYYFQDQEMGDMYDNEVRLSIVIKAFTLICIVIACLGLIGLSTFSSIRRYKEIGIRKVLGASVSNILFLMSKEFIVLSVIGFIISIPVANYLVSRWLEGFAYHINLEWWMVALAGGIALTLTLLTVGLQSIKAAIVNPVESLRRE
ncbi:MAG: FtsX-like permease family protein, partial [Bacteroidota bacterium]